MIKLSGVLPAARKMKDFERIAHSNFEILILLETRIAQIHQMVNYAHKRGKKVLVHTDLINGLKVDRYGMEYLIRVVKVDGVISTRANVIALAKKNEVIAIQRLFALDSLALQNSKRLVEQSKPNYVEVLPGIIPSVIEEVAVDTGIPVIAGGLINTKEQANQASNAGAIAVTTSNNALWEFEF
ncbi:glycerol-3-phosphate responsive antiterminator [Gracilibacillus sp. JCM 18860]|uniref:glycerol-3-phosphate responsive antiterminator n=1 Tax=Gracilibacillus sp. JCM 18860 TaxID=1306159 RepID=UPI0006D1C91F